MQANITKLQLVKLLTRFQDEGDVVANQIATEAIKKFGLKRLHDQNQRLATRRAIKRILS